MASHLRSDKVTKFKPLGNKIDEFKGPSDSSFDIYYVDCATEPSFQDYHSKLQPWIMFYIDAASYIGKPNCCFKISPIEGIGLIINQNCVKVW